MTFDFLKGQASFLRAMSVKYYLLVFFYSQMTPHDSFIPKISSHHITSSSFSCFSLIFHIRLLFYHPIFIRLSSQGKWRSKNLTRFDISFLLLQNFYAVDRQKAEKNEKKFFIVKNWEEEDENCACFSSCIFNNLLSLKKKKKKSFLLL